MKNIIIVMLVFTAMHTSAKEQYWVSSFGDLLFQYSNVQSSTVKLDPEMRFSGWFHFGQYKHTDFSKAFGIYTGLGVKNIGLIYKYSEDGATIKRKHRAYTLGVPLALKIGDLNADRYFYAGGEVELAFHYKQKRFDGGNKTVEAAWFSQRVNLVQPSVHVGWHFSEGWNVEAKYYLRDFLNKDFAGDDFNEPIDYKSYGNSQIFYLSLSIKIRSDKLQPENKDNETQFAFR